MVKKFGKHVRKVDQMKVIHAFSKAILVTLAALVILVGFRIDTQRKSPSPVGHANVELPNVQVEKMNEGITKMYNEKMCLINVTSKDEKSLAENVVLIFESNLLAHKSESHVNR